MNPQFANYATGVAFQLLLTKAQVRALVGMSAPKGSRQEIINVCVWKSTASLLHKGLIVSTGKGYALTDAGKLTIKLLDEAGLIPARNKTQALSPKFVKSLHDEAKA